MTRADQAGSLGSSRTRTPLVVYRIAVGAERERNQAVGWEARLDWTISMLTQIMCVCCSPDIKNLSFSFNRCFHETSLLGFCSLAVFLLAYTTKTKESLWGLAETLSSVPSPRLTRTGAMSPPQQWPGSTSEPRAASWLKSSCSNGATSPPHRAPAYVTPSQGCLS